VLIGYALVLVSDAGDDTFELTPGYAELYTLTVAPEARGAGVGGRLMDAVDDLVRARTLGGSSWRRRSATRAPCGATSGAGSCRPRCSWSVSRPGLRNAAARRATDIP
jgi:GNAT superfamily N-acetyltransferase